MIKRGCVWATGVHRARELRQQYVRQRHRAHAAGHAAHWLHGQRLPRLLACPARRQPHGSDRHRQRLGPQRESVINHISKHVS